MKKFLILLLLLFKLINVAISQEQEFSDQIIPFELDYVQQTALSNLPELQMPDECKNRTLPYKVNNSETPYYRTPFPQEGLSCGQASSVGMCFTYEINRARGLPANVNENLYSTHFAYNWANGGYDSGSSYYHTLEVLKKVGTPNQADYAGSTGYESFSHWMSGYDLYYNAMLNRLNKAYKINIGTAEGMQVLKNWMYDHLNGTTPGGCAFTYSSNRYPQTTLPRRTEEEGMYVILNGTRSSSHSFTFLGYNDSIRYDYNGDGRYTNDEDINGDGIIDMRDWEIGGLIMSETYFGATAWANGGYCYVMYKAIADGYIWNDIVHVMDVNPTYEPLLTAKVNMTYTQRERIKIYVGASADLNSNKPDHIIDFPIFSYQGGFKYMQGGTTEEDKTIEFGLDLTPLLNLVNPQGENVKYFLQIYEDDPRNQVNGTINSFSIINYAGDNPIETLCNRTNVNIINGVTTLSVNAPYILDKVVITSEALPTGSIMDQYTTQLEASGGTTPYHWSFNNDYFITKSTSIFQNEGSDISSNSLIDLNFNFNYFGEEYNRIHVNNKGFIFFENFETYIPFGNTGMETMLFYNNKCITPFHVFGSNTTIKYINESNYVTIIWTSDKLKYSATLHENGNIVFSYNDSNISLTTPYICGVSKGDGVNFNTVIFDNNFEIENGLTYTFSTYGKPEDFEISENGELTGIPSRDYLSELLHFKVTDNNGIINRKSLIFLTDGFLLDFNVNTSNGDSIIEYGENVTLDLNINNPFNVQITNINIEAVCPDEYITITNANISIPVIDPLSSITIDNSFSFTVNSNVPNNYNFCIYFTVTTENKTWEYSKTFTAYAPVLSISSIEVNDDNDNILTSNETVNLNLKIFNSGEARANNLTFSAFSNDPNITITNPVLTATNINPDSYYNYIVEVVTSSEIAETYNSIINIEITGDNGFNETISGELTIDIPVIEIINIYNINNILPGETGDIGINLKNTGLLNATNITATLSCNNPDITINANSQFFENIDIEEIKYAIFNVNFNENCYYGQEIALNITINSDFGLNYTFPFRINIGYVMEDFETGDFSYLVKWEHSGDSNWHIVNDEVFEGMYSLRSGNINHSQRSEIKTSIYVSEEAPVSFIYKVSSETNDKLLFYIDNILIDEYSGAIDWTSTSYTIPEGYHTLKWIYKKNSYGTELSDAAWIDNIIFPLFNNTEPMLSCNVSSREQYITISQQETQNITISNIGGREIDYQVSLIPTETNCKSIQGSNISTDFQNFVPGETYEITFSLNAISPDSEYITKVEIQFPEEIILNSASNIRSSTTAGALYLSYITTGPGAKVIWTSPSALYGIRNGDRIEFTVNITFDNSWTNTYSLINYKIIGEIFGSEPHIVESSIILSKNSGFWLSVTPDYGNILTSAEKELLLTFNSEDLQLGIYDANIRISSIFNTLNIPVRLIVIPETNISSQTTSVYKELKKNQEDFETITINNSGTGANYQIEITDADNPENENVTWLSVNPPQGMINHLDDIDFTINFNSENLSTGSYNAIIKITAGNSQITIPVELKVVSENLTCETTSIYKELEKDREITEIITISNTGVTTIIDVELINSDSKNIEWFYVDPLHTTINKNDETDFAVTFNSNSLDLGSYFAEIRFNAENSFISIPVELKVIKSDDNYITNITRNDEIVCFPNPFSNSISIKFTSINEEIKYIKLVDIMGKEILTLDNNIKIFGKEDTFTYNISESIPSGMYFIKVETSTSIFFSKITKK